jgi:hypothetical protein
MRLLMNSISYLRILATRVLAAAARVLATRVLAARVLATRILAARILATQVLAALASAGLAASGLAASSLATTTLATCNRYTTTSTIISHSLRCTVHFLYLVLIFYSGQQPVSLKTLREQAKKLIKDNPQPFLYHY